VLQRLPRCPAARFAGQCATLSAGRGFHSFKREASPAWILLWDG